MSSERHKVRGIGGVFFRAKDPKALAAWYAEHLGLPIEAGGYGSLQYADAGPDASLVWSVFPADTEYFGPGGKELMVNYRVDDLDAMLDQLRAAGAPVEGPGDDESFGRFGWATDPEGNRFELWQPPPGH